MRSCSHSDTECPECFLDRMRSISPIGHRVNSAGQFGRDVEKRNESELASYRAERKAGSQPDGTTRKNIDAAKAASDRLGVPYRGDNKTQMAKDAGLIDSVTPTRGHYKKFAS